MAFVITRSCINDTSCVSACPVNSIHPTPDEPGYKTAEMLYIDPSVCIECGACMDACPVSAIFPEYELPDTLEEYQTINARYYEEPEHSAYEQTANAPTDRQFTGTFTSTLRVAIVGSGPSACYAAEDLLSTKGINVEVDMFERLPTPFGLVRYGVAPDHQDTKTVTDTFGSIFRRKGFRLFLNTEVGRDISHETLAESYHAVIYASGASKDRTLGIAGEDLPGSHPATDFVGWYNGHPDHADHTFDLSGERAVILGNGNVALDIARLLTAEHPVLERSDMADHALTAIQDSRITEVVIVARRGPAEAAFTTPELLGLMSTRGITVRTAGAEISPTNTGDDVTAQKLETLQRLPAPGTGPGTGERMVTLRFLSNPVEILGDDRVTGIRVARTELIDEGGVTSARVTEDTEVIPAGLVLRSVGYRGTPIPNLPFDERRGIVPNEHGRVHGETPAYVTGWIKRGPSGVIGTNRACAADTIDALLADAASGRIADAPRDTAEAISTALPNALDVKAWKKLDRHERTEGRSAGRPRRKTTSISTMLEVINAPR